ncbi:hypothetical protein BZA70DRAFT_283260 [Myxozyma melibiosi]|uniref:Uncharacterized protein n=1 Tax=Myxozyma melibiosi TaxID=54550 RepID=A0ABR1F088_9ASCO
MSQSSDLYNVPPRRNPGPKPGEKEKKAEHPQPLDNPDALSILNAKRYSDVFWAADDKLSKRDRRDILTELNRCSAYQILGSTIGGVLMCVGGYQIFKRNAPGVMRSMTAFSTLFGASYGAGVGANIAIVEARRDFEKRKECAEIMTLIALRPTFGLWRNYYGDGNPPKNVLSAWWTERNNNKGGQNVYYGDFDTEVPYGGEIVLPFGDGEGKSSVDDEERKRPFGGVADVEPTAPSSWDLAVARRKAEREGTIYESEPPRYERRKSKAGKKKDEFFETEEEFREETRFETEGQEIGEPADDFSASEKRFSQSRYD